MIDRVPEELWTEVCDIVQEAVIKTIPKKKKFKKAKLLSEEALQPFYVFLKWKSLKKIADVFSLLTFNFKLLPPFEHYPHLEIKIKVSEVHI